MAKRELLIIALFGAAGVLAYQLLAPASTASGPGLPIANWLERARAGDGGPAVASISRDGAFALGENVTLLRVSGVSAVILRGEPRGDVAYQLTVEANGPDEAGARAAAERVRLTRDEAAAVLSLGVEAPREARLTGALTLIVPSRLSAIIEGARSTEVSGLAGVTLDRVVGDAHLRDLEGAVTGSHRNGDLSVSGASRVALNLLETSATFTGVRDDIRLTARNGESRLDANPARVEIDGTGHTARLTDPSGPVRILGTGGEIHLTRPRGTVHVDVERAAVTLMVATPVPIAVFTSERRVRLTLGPDLTVTVDARTSEDGTIDATALGLAPEITPDGERVQLIHAGAPAIAIRNRRGAIEIVEAK